MGSKMLSATDSDFRAAFHAREQEDKKFGFSRGEILDVVLAALTESAQSDRKSGDQRQKVGFSPKELLTTFQKVLIADEPRINFDYATFVCCCLKLAFELIHIVQFEGPLHQRKVCGNPIELVLYLLQSAVAAKASKVNVAATPFGRVAKYMQAVLAKDNYAKQFSQAAFNKSSGRIPKGERPQFAPPDLDAGKAFQELLNMLPSASIGSSRQTIEIYDPKSTSLKDFHRLLDSSTMQSCCQMVEGATGATTLHLEA